MTGPGFETDAERLGQRAGEFETLNRRAAEIAERLREAVSSTPWGDDEVGQAFESRHRGHADETAGVFDALSGGLADMGESLSSAASAYLAADESAAESITESGRES
ncbi:hypothetical protein ACZ91_17070 [Streptomyces regensis]|uniref:WXG100 family type VII secretion target n=2 Tax=Prauserella rugosa TaxID=43354 RepID=A0A660CL75_9PSEU|nr:hypothetical protein HQ32_03749 [Prauserella sp. Am3]KMS90068.1 hypothetical protein ACZ91_17070 [Streptomyces regensis]TWH22409.1 hypothetical protein JD82_04290 [Prauserella rugosa]